LLRSRGAPAFAPREVELVAGVAQPLGESISANDDAHALLGELPDDCGRDGLALGVRTTATAATTAVVIEPARAAELASILLAASELTPRERQVTHLLAQGLALPRSPTPPRSHVTACATTSNRSSRS
jgi:hypothetical protein